MAERGPRAPLKMPDLTEMPLARARRVLGFYGLNVSLQLVERPGPASSEVLGASADGRAARTGPTPGTGADSGLNTVFAQLPPAGTPLRPGETVRLAVRQESPIQYLPEIFQLEDERAQDTQGTARPPQLLRRFLLLIQQQYSGLENTVESLHEVFDPARAPRHMLPWLARFLPLELDASWSTDKVRQVMLQAPALLALRGTARGLEAMIRLYFELEVTVRENTWPHRGVVVGQSRVGGLVCVSTVPPPSLAFTVELPVGVSLDPVTHERLLRLVDREKPAHLRACVVRAPAHEVAAVQGPRPVVGQYVVGR